MKKYMPLIKDGFTLILFASAFVLVFKAGFDRLKKTADIDPIVTAVNQGNEKNHGNVEKIKVILGPIGFEKEKNHFATLEAFEKDRVNRHDDLGRNPLMWASYANFLDDEQTKSVDKSRAEALEYLIAHGADLNAVDKDAWTALMWASWSGLTNTAGKLLEKGASTSFADTKGNTALMIASMRGNLEIVKLLLAKGADKTAKGPKGKNAADFAQEGMKQYKEKAAAYQGILQILGNG